jgi:ABC-type lipoprotein release transport system permease subunit
MGYRRVLLARWSRRDRLAVLVVAVTLAFLVGTALLVVAAGDQTAAIASEEGTPGIAAGYDSLAAARAAASPGAAVLPVATAREGDGARVTVVGRTSSGTELDNATSIDLFGGERGATRGTITEPRTVRFDGEQGSETRRVGPRGRTVLAPDWYVASPRTVRSLGVTGAIVVTPTEGSAPPSGVPLRGALSFFLLGTLETLRILSVAAVGAGLLIGVTIHSVTRMTIQDRLDAIRVARATGADPRQLLIVFGLRGALLAGVGTALGYAIGVILPGVAVNAAVFLGLPTSLAVEVTPTIWRVVAIIAAVTIGVGATAGVAAVWPATRRPIADLGRVSGVRGGDRSWLSPRLLSPTAFVPAAATLTAFVIFATLVVAMGGVVAPLSTTDGATVSEPGAVHPIASDVPEAYATGVRSRGIAASPEILGFVATDGQPFVVRGVNATAFTELTGATVTAGRYPEKRTEALVGADLARSLNVAVGDRMFVGGSTTAAVTKIAVVGRVAAPGALDDQLLVSLPTARHLTRKGPGRVQFIRTSGVPDRASERDNGGTNGSVGVIDIAVPNRVAANGSMEVRVRLANDGLREATRRITVAFDGTTHSRRITLDSGATRSVSVSVPTGPPGTDSLRVAGQTRSITVVAPDAIELRGIPNRVPPNSTPRVRVETLTGDPVSNASVSGGTRTVRTGPDGVAAVPLGGVGEYAITARRDTETAGAAVSVVAGVPRDPLLDLRVDPSSPGVLTRPTARIDLTNPWNRTLSRTLRIEEPGEGHARPVTLAPGETASLAIRLRQRPPGSYDVVARIDGRSISKTTYSVTGDDRIAAAIAEGATPGGTGIGRSAQIAFGNLELVLGVIVVLAGLMTVGGTTVTFARAVQGRRRTIGIYRATGARPRRVLVIVLGDALRIGVAATAVALLAGIAALSVFAAAGLLSPFGVRLPPVPDPTVALGIAGGALGVALLGATLATVGFLREAPVALLSEDRAGRAGRDSHRSD